MRMSYRPTIEVTGWPVGSHIAVPAFSLYPSAMTATVLIRPSTDDDVPAMLDIYRSHVHRGVDDLLGPEEEPFEIEDLKKRRKNMKKRRLPHLVAETGGQVVGYAYAVPFRKRPAYRYTVKHSIYMHGGFLHAGIGRLLLPALIEACAAAGYLQMIGYIDATNAPSLRLHEACGFVRVGLLPSVGFKYGRWTDSVMMQRPLGPGDSAPPRPWEGAAPSPPPEAPPLTVTPDRA
ncbi:phosphinothricin N-acetyltransferase [mine drainage metagenome]|uniref:Phosphinothricin N-acetyltransferase n=1 Tax=mine drainage metagenome TaxID=410659 RepID=A0A1J5S198_9ZZZZ